MRPSVSTIIALPLVTSATARCRVTTHSGSPLALSTSDLRGGAAGISMGASSASGRCGWRPALSVPCGTRVRAEPPRATYICEEPRCASRAVLFVYAEGCVTPVWRTDTVYVCHVDSYSTSWL